MDPDNFFERTRFVCLFVRFPGAFRRKFSGLASGTARRNPRRDPLRFPRLVNGWLPGVCGDEGMVQEIAEELQARRSAAGRVLLPWCGFKGFKGFPVGVPSKPQQHGSLFFLLGV